MGSKGHAEPPEGAIVGESVPKESEPDNFSEAKIKTVMNTLKSRPAYRALDDGQKREKAIQLLKRNEASL